MSPVKPYSTLMPTDPDNPEVKKWSNMPDFGTYGDVTKIPYPTALMDTNDPDEVRTKRKYLADYMTFLRQNNVTEKDKNYSTALKYYTDFGRYKEN